MIFTMRKAPGEESFEHINRCIFQSKRVKGARVRATAAVSSFLPKGKYNTMFGDEKRKVENNTLCVYNTKKAHMRVLCALESCVCMCV